MKTHILLLFCLSALLVSCNDWLDVKPSTQLDREELFTTEAGYAEAIKGVYTQMCAAPLYGREMTWGSMDVLGGNFLGPNYPGIYNDMGAYSYVRGDKNVSDAAIKLVGEFWSAFYNALAGINAVIEKIDGSKNLFSGDNYHILKGEALGIRAFIHFELLRMFGDAYEASRTKETIPFLSELSPKVAPLLNGEAVMTIIIAQLEEALQLLEKDPMRLGVAPLEVLASIPATSADYNIFSWHNRRFHFNYYAAKATLARAYLWKGDKAKALGLALEIIAEQETRFPWALSDNLIAIETSTKANQDRTFATEHIFALNITDMEHYLGVVDNKSGWESQKLKSALDMFGGDDRGADPRYKYMYTGFGPGVSLLSKYYQLTSVSAYFKFRMPLIRISEMFYIAAECSPNWQDGLEYLEAVRRNRGLGSMALTHVDGPESLQEEIYNEYRKEFVGEGQLWFYYKRHQYNSIVNTTYNKGSKGYIFPLPDDEILYGKRD